MRIARETYKIPNVVARIYDPRRAEIYQRLGIPTVATVTWTIDQVRRRLLPDEDVGDWSDATGRLTLIDRSLPDAWAGRPLCDLEQPGRLSLVAVTRAGVPRLDARELVGQEGDVLHLAVLDDALRQLDETLARSEGTSPDGAIVKVAIAGAGSVGTAIASDLHANGHEVLVIEQDPDLVERLRPTLDVTWVAADACEVSSLDAAGLATVDVVVAATGDDEDNLVISLLAKQEFAVPRVVARVNHPKNQWLFNESWGVDVSVSTPQLLTALVEEAVSVGSLVRLLQFQGGAAHLVEITLAEDSPANDTAIADLDFPRDAVVVAVVRADRLIVPRGDTTLQSGDEVLVLVTAEAEDAVHALFIAEQTGVTATGWQPPRQPSSRAPNVRGPVLQLSQLLKAWVSVARTMRGMEAAFFDLDKTVIDRASIAAFGRPFLKGGLINRRLVARAAISQLIYLYFGADEDRLVRVRESMLAVTKGWDRAQVRQIVRETMLQTIEPIMYAEALELMELHRAAGHRVYLVSASPEEIVLPLADLLGVDGAICSRGEVDEQGRYTGRMAFYAYGESKATAMRELAERTGIDLAPAAPTRTRPPTCRCSRRSGARWRSTPTARWPRWRANAAGRSATSPSRSACATGWVARHRW